MVLQQPVATLCYLFTNTLNYNIRYTMKGIHYFCQLPACTNDIDIVLLIGCGYDIHDTMFYSIHTHSLLEAGEFEIILSCREKKNYMYIFPLTHTL